MGIKDFFMKKALQSQLKGMPKEQQEMLMGMLQENPELFKTIAEEMKQLTKQGKGQMEAMMVVMKKHQSELQKILGRMMDKNGGMPDGMFPR